MEVFGGFAGIGIIIVAIAFSWAQIRNGGSRAKDDLVQTLKDSLEVEKEKVKNLSNEKNTLIISHQNQLTELTEKIGKLQGLYEGAERRSQEYLTILQGRNPEQQEFMKFLTKTAADSAAYMADTTTVLGEIKTFMTLMNAEIAKGNIFNKEIEEATAHETGKPLRKKV